MPSEDAEIFTYGRTRDLMIRKERKGVLLKRCTVLVLLLTGFLASPGYFLLYLFYLLLSIPVLNAAAAILKRAKVIKPERLCSPEFRFAGIGFCFLFPALIVLAGAFNNKHPQIKEIFVELPRKSSRIDELKIAFASDFHLGFDDHMVLDRFVTRANGLHPDIIMIGGDMLDFGVAGVTAADLAEFKEQFRRLKARYGVYAVLGNHDCAGSDKIDSDYFADSGMKLLNNSVDKIEDAFYLMGRPADLPHKSINELLMSAPDDLPVFLLEHYLPHMDRISSTGIDLHLSGHTHNGQMFPINLLGRLEYELPYGVRVKNNTLFIVTSGIHYSIPPINTVGFSEIVYIRAVFRSNLEKPEVLGWIHRLLRSDTGIIFKNRG